jgi:glyoxylase-like metal-dependent hydrolase (beta-lactamase superfamily II)
MAREVLPGVHRILFPKLAVHAFLIDGDDGLTLIDAGVASRGGRPILGTVARLGKRPSDLRAVLVTHYHSDHVGNLAAVVRATGAEVYVHPEDAEVVRSGSGYPMGTPVDRLGKILGIAFGPLIPKRSEPSPVHHEVEDGAEIPVAGGLRVIHTPGHTPGHISVLWPARRLLFAGDVAGNSLGRLGFSVQYLDYAQAKASLAKVASLEFDSALFGHGRTLRGQANATFRRFVERHADS